jgi:hypothetical protein
MNEHNQFSIKPGTYEHYKVNTDGKHPIYVLENIITHREVNGVWTKFQDPLVVYRNLEPQYESINDASGQKSLVIKTYQKPISEWLETTEVDGKTIRKYKPI